MLARSKWSVVARHGNSSIITTVTYVCYLTSSARMIANTPLCQTCHSSSAHQASSLCAVSQNRFSKPRPENSHKLKPKHIQENDWISTWIMTDDLSDVHKNYIKDCRVQMKLHPAAPALHCSTSPRGHTCPPSGCSVRVFRILPYACGSESRFT